jgi:hypothetical protein
MASRPRDTSPAAWAVYNTALDRMSGSDRVQVAVDLSEAVREIRLAGIRARHGEFSRADALRRLILEEYGVALPTEP